MRNLIALTAREWKSFWYSPIAYVVGAFFLVLQGFGFWFLMNALNDPRMDPTMTVSQLFYGTFWYWFSILFMGPVFTMRTFSEEKRTGTIEVLMSAPVTDAQVVVSKFLGAWLSYCAIWALTLVYFVIFRRYAVVDWAAVFSGYLGTVSLGAIFIALGVFASSMTRNQVIAGFVSFVLSFLLLLIGLLGVFMKGPEAAKILGYVAIFEHVQDFSKGIIDTRPLVFYASTVAVLLFLTTRTVANPRWRA